MNAVGSFIGPIAGGLLLRRTSWRWCFLVTVPFVIVSVVFGRFLVPTSKDPRQTKFEVPRAVDMNVAGVELIGDTHRPAQVVGADVATEAVRRRVRFRDGVRFVREGRDLEDRAEDLLLPDLGVWVDVREHGGLDVEAAGQFAVQLQPVAAGD